MYMKDCLFHNDKTIISAEGQLLACKRTKIQTLRVWLANRNKRREKMRQPLGRKVWTLVLPKQKVIAEPLKGEGSKVSIGMAFIVEESFCSNENKSDI